MIIDRYNPCNLFEMVPKLKLELEPELAELDRLLDDDALFQWVKADLSRRYPNTPTLGRPSTPVEVILRMLVVRRLYDWSYQETEHFVSDSLVLRQFCRLYLEPAPDDTTLLRWAGLIGPETLKRLNDHLVLLARQLKVTRGRKLRTDGTVVETHIHYPTDSSLLADGVRVISRLIRNAKKIVRASGPGARALFRDRTRSAKRLARQIGDTVRRRGEAAELARRTTYQKLLGVAQASLRQAGRVRQRLALSTTPAAQRLVSEMEHFVPLIQQVVRQTRRRVLEGEAVPAGEKLVSLFESHTRIIRRGKAGHETEFGRKVWLDEVEGGILTGYRVLDGNPGDANQAMPSLIQHHRLFGHAPGLFAADRGVYSAGNEVAAQRAGVKRVVLPKPGAKSRGRVRHERQGWFRRGRRFRAGSEGRISVLKRRGYLGRCRDRGEAGFGRWVGWGILTANLTTIARTVAART
jgi:IS5 family transposase